MINKRKKILLWGWFGFENLGDDLLMQTVIEKINIGNIDITVPMNKTYNSPYLKGVKQTKRSYLKMLFGFINNDILIIGPGGLFPYDDLKKTTIYRIIINIWKLFGRKVLFFGIDVTEKMSAKNKALWKKIINKSDIFLTRNNNLFKALGLKEDNKHGTMADAVFSFKNHSQIKANKSVIISVANLIDDDKLLKSNVSVWVDVVEYLLKKGYKVKLTAFTKGSDDKMIDAIAEVIDSKKIQVYRYKDSPQIIEQWGENDLAICMRFHSFVLSIINDVPAIPIAYGDKTKNLAKITANEDNLVIWNNYKKEYYGKYYNISSSEIIEKIDSIKATANLKTQNAKKELKESADRAFNVLISEINK